MNKWTSHVLLRAAISIGLLAVLSGCVTRGKFDALSTDHESLRAQRDELVAQVERLEVERDLFEAQFLEAQEGYEDERVGREMLASNLAQVEQKASKLDTELSQERMKHELVAAALVKRDAELSSMQSTYDTLVTDLESEVSAGQIAIERLRDGLRLNVSDDVLFASGSADLDAIGRDVLIKVAGQLKSLDDWIEVSGHTDDRKIRGALAKRFPSNWDLAAARSARVVRLLEKYGVPGERLRAVSRGPFEPVRPNDTVENRAMNRRIEIRLQPKPPEPEGS